MEFKEIKNKFSIKEKKIIKNFNVYQNKFNSCQGGDFYLWGYDKIYSKYLKNIKNEKVKICEIGILEGHKLLIMSNYFTNCELYGYDIDISYFKYFNETFKKKIKNIQKINSTNSNETKNILETFDIIIDDGDHRPNSILLTFNNFYSKLNDNGIYII